MRSSPILVRLPSLVALAAATTMACTSEDSSSDYTYTASVTTTLLSIEPASFIGDARCSNEGGALQSYVVTLFDHTDATHIATLPSSPPTSCSQALAFRFVLPGHVYTAEIDGYDAPTTSVEPAGGAASGSRSVVPVGGDTELTPRWTASCGAVTASKSAIIPFKSCSELVDHGPAPATSIVVDPRTSLGDLRCAAAGGEVVTFDITPEGAALPSVTGIPCGGAPITYNAGIKPDEPYTFRVEARAKAGGPVVWGTSCNATPSEGFINTAVCDPLTASGVIEVSINDLLKAAKLACGADAVAAVETVLVDPHLSSGPTPCGAPTRFGPLDPGAYKLTTRALRSDGSIALEATCTADVLPGATTKATCM